MKLPYLVVIFLAQGILLVECAAGRSSAQDLERALEDVLKIVKQINSSSAAEKTDLIGSTQNLTISIHDLTNAVINNTEVLKRALVIDGIDEGVLVPGRARCEAPFFPVKSECFYVNQYKRVSWSEARNFCKGLGADLAQPDEVNTLRATLLAKFPEDVYQFFWVGASESGGEGNWIWLSQRPVDRKDWATGQPDGGNENCVGLSRDDFPALHDSPCYTHAFFICERIVLRSQ